MTFGADVLTVFLLSPANCGGTRAQQLLKSRTSPLTARLANGGVPLGEVFTFMSSLYFRGKLAYATRFGRAYVIAPGRGLLPADVLIRVEDLQQMASVEVDEALPAFRDPLVRDATTIAGNLGAADRVVLLGSVATDKYVGPLLDVFGDRLYFPPTFAGRGDMSRGGLLLRCANAGTPLEYAPLRGAVRHGPKPPKLPRLK
ncbi:MAG TPA: hypothetical protein VFM23_07565 [Gemmatimonadales bacterium]|nr:hypothetical protein [Gemmatimonadales bacterium]